MRKIALFLALALILSVPTIANAATPEEISPLAVKILPNISFDDEIAKCTVTVVGGNMGWEVLKIVAGIVIFSLLGLFFLFKRDNAFSKGIGHGVYDHKKVSYLLGIGFLGIATAIIPILLSTLFDNNWLLFLSVAILIVLIAYVWIYELNGKLK